MSTLQNDTIQEYIQEQLEYLFENDDDFHDLIEDKAIDCLDSYDCDDLDFLSENSLEYLCDLAEHIFNSCEETSPNSPEEVKECAYFVWSNEDMVNGMYGFNERNK